MTSMAVVDAEDLRTGLLSTPIYVPEELQWLTDEGWNLYHIRNKTSDFYTKEAESITKACNAITDKLTDNILIIDVGAGDVNLKAITMLEALLKDHPERKICYVPLDISEKVKNWSKLSEHAPSVTQQVVEIIPVVGDMVHVLHQIDTYVPNLYSKWPVLFSSFGPNTMPLPNRVYLESFNEVSKFINQKGSGWYLVTYLQSTENTPQMVTEHVFNKMDMTGMLRAILLGLNKVAEADLDLSAFDYKTKFAEKFSTEGVAGNWTGCVYYAEATRDVFFKSAKLKIERTIKKGEIIRLSEGEVKSHYYEDKYLTSLGSNKGIAVVGNWPESSGLLSCMVYRL